MNNNHSNAISVNNPQCPICESINTGKAKININYYLCYYCYTFFNTDDDFQPRDKLLQNNLLQYINKNLDKKLHKNILCLSSLDLFDKKDIPNHDIFYVNFHSSKFDLDLVKILKNVQLNVILIPNLNIFNIKELFSKILKITNNETKIIIGYYNIFEISSTEKNNEILNNSKYINNIFSINKFLTQQNIGIIDSENSSNYSILNLGLNTEDSPDVIKENQKIFDKCFKLIIC